MEIKPMHCMRKNKKGQLGLDVVEGVVFKVLLIAVLVFAAILALVSLRDSGVFTANSLEANQTTNIVNNISTASSDFFSNMGTIFDILAVVVIILAVVIIIVTVRRARGSRGV